LGTASRGVGLEEVQKTICSAYKGPKKYYPEQCETLAGAQKEFPPDDADEDGKDATTYKPTLEALNAETEDKDEEESLDLPMKEETDSSGKVRLEVFWRAFW
jgi:hypothetical protein